MTGQTMTGKVLGDRYEIKDRIGIGGMAEVYRAQDHTLARIVAVKVMLPQFAADPAFAARFRQEAAAAANLQSPYIVNVYDWGHEDGTYYIVMEFVRGSDLKTAIQQRGAINQRKVAEIGSQVCQALTVAHNQDIIHRDIKPQNIMVQPDGNVKVMDFGIARAKNSVNDKTAAVLGTAHYISPEQAQGKDLTAASDIYSLGVVLYEAATGKLPFDAPDAVSVAMMQVKDEPVPPIDINPDLDPALNDIIMCAMAKNPNQRFATANDMRMALNDYLAGRPVALPGGAAAGFTSAATSVIPPANTGTQVMPAVGGVAPANTNAYSPTRNYSADHTAQKSKKKPILIALAVVAALALIAGIAFAVAGNKGGEAVPDVTGMTVEQATPIIEKAGFTVGTVTPVFDESVEEGQIISQDPAANANAEEGSAINLIISQGTEPVEVPDLSGKSVDEAKAIAAGLGLQIVESESKYSDSVKEGRIISTTPSAGERVDPGSTIEYVLSRGSETTKAPRVIGETEDSARSILEGEGFSVNVIEASSDKYDKGVVMSQDPLNDPIKPGGTVTIKVSTGPSSIEIPDVVNRTESDAQNRLESAGFKVSINRSYSSDVDKGYVISQSKSGAAKEGATVTITVSRGPEPSSSDNGSNANKPSTGGGSNTGDSGSDDANA